MSMGIRGRARIAVPLIAAIALLLSLFGAAPAQAAIAPGVQAFIEDLFCDEGQQNVQVWVDNNSPDPVDVVFYVNGINQTNLSGTYAGTTNPDPNWQGSVFLPVVPQLEPGTPYSNTVTINGEPYGTPFEGVAPDCSQRADLIVGTWSSVCDEESLALVGYSANGAVGVLAGRINGIPAPWGSFFIDGTTRGAFQIPLAGLMAGAVFDVDLTLDGIAVPGSAGQVTVPVCADNGTPPPVDTDGDGITDDKDTCPGTVAGATVDANGCSAAQRDSDNDGITDDKDTCPGTVAGATVDANGCVVVVTPPPDTRPVPTAKVRAKAAKSVLFVDINPDRPKSGYWTFQVQKLSPDGVTWIPGRTYKTKGSKETRSINLKKGTYRVVVSPDQFGYQGVSSAAPVYLRK